MEKYVKVFQGEGSREESILKLSCLKEALEDQSILHQIVYKCYFDNSNHCLYPIRPKTPEICQQFLCAGRLKESSKPFQCELHSRKNADIEVYVLKENASLVRNIIMPAVSVKAEKMKTIVQELGLMRVEEMMKI